MLASVCIFLIQHLACAIFVDVHKPTGQGVHSLLLFYGQGMRTKREQGWLRLYRNSLDLV